MSTIFPPDDHQPTDGAHDDAHDDGAPTTPLLRRVQNIAQIAAADGVFNGNLPLAETEAGNALSEPGLPRVQAVQLFDVARRRFPRGDVAGLSVECLTTTDDPARDLFANIYVVSGFLPTVAEAQGIPLSQTYFRLLAYDDIDMLMTRLETTLDLLPL